MVGVCVLDMALIGFPFYSDSRRLAAFNGNRRGRPAVWMGMEQGVLATSLTPSYSILSVPITLEFASQIMKLHRVFSEPALGLLTVQGKHGGGENSLQ